MSKTRGHCRHYREIDIADLPMVKDSFLRLATDAELKKMSIKSATQSYPEDVMIRFGYKYKMARLDEKKELGLMVGETKEREATLQELMDHDIHILRNEDGSYIRRGNKVWALVLAYHNRDNPEPEMADGSPCIGVEIIGKPGMYGKKREGILDQILEFEPEEKEKIKDLKAHRPTIMGDEE